MSPQASRVQKSNTQEMEKDDVQGDRFSKMKTNSQGWSTRIAFKNNQRNMDYHHKNQEFIHLISDKRAFRKMKSKSLQSSVQNSFISLRTRHIEKMESNKSTSRTCNANPTFSQQKHLEKESQKDDALKKCRS